MGTRKRKTTFIGTSQHRAEDRKAYSARYRADHPLLQGRVPDRVYREALRRARAVDFSLSKFLGYWLQMTFAEHPINEEA